MIKIDFLSNIITQLTDYDTALKIAINKAFKNITAANINNSHYIMMPAEDYMQYCEAVTEYNQHTHDMAIKAKEQEINR